MTTRNRDKIDLRLATDADIPALLAFVAEMGFNPRSERTWRGLSMGAMTAWDGTRLIGAVPFEPRILQAGGGRVVRVLHETVVAVHPDFRATGVGGRLQTALSDGECLRKIQVASASRTGISDANGPSGDDREGRHERAETRLAAPLAGRVERQDASPDPSRPTRLASEAAKQSIRNDVQSSNTAFPENSSAEADPASRTADLPGTPMPHDLPTQTWDVPPGGLPPVDGAMHSRDEWAAGPGLLTVFREDPASSAYRWYLKCGFTPLLRIESFFADDPQEIAASEYHLIPHDSPEADHAAIASVWEQTHGFAPGPVSRRHRPIGRWLDVHPYADRYRFFWVIGPGGWSAGHVLLGVGRMHSAAERADILQLAGDTETLVRLAARACADQGWTPLRWPVAAGGPEAIIARRLGMSSRWTFDMLCKPMGPGPMAATIAWQYSGLDFA